jgi:hippurate hydrolase
MEESNYLAHSLVQRIGEFINIRRDIHARPELAFEEHQTASLVANKLKGWGL